MQDVVGHAIQSKTFFATIVVTTTACFTVEIFQITFRQLTKPTVSDKIRKEVIQDDLNIDDFHQAKTVCNGGSEELPPLSFSSTISGY